MIASGKGELNCTPAEAPRLRVIFPERLISSENRITILSPRERRYAVEQSIWHPVGETSWSCTENVRPAARASSAARVPIRFPPRRSMPDPRAADPVPGASRAAAKARLTRGHRKKIHLLRY